jgi:hypothetical protein
MPPSLVLVGVEKGCFGISPAHMMRVLRPRGENQMAGGLKKRFTGFMIWGVILCRLALFAVTREAADTKAKQGAEMQGYLYIASHDEVVARARETLHVSETLHGVRLLFFALISLARPTQQ